MAKLEAKTKVALKDAPVASVPSVPAAGEPAASVGDQASAPLDNVELKASPEMAAQLAPVVAQAEAAANEGVIAASASDADREALLKAVAAIGSEAAAVLPTSADMTFAERIYIISAPGGPRRRANLAFGPEPRELVWEDLGDTDEAREQALDALRADPLIKIDGRYEERPAED